MQRLQFGYSLLDESQHGEQHYHPHKYLEEFSWAQILSTVQPISQIEDHDRTEAVNYHINGVKESDETHSFADTTDLGTNSDLNQVVDQDAVEHQLGEQSLLSQGDIVERPRELWSEHRKEHSEAPVSSQSPLSLSWSSIFPNDKSETSYSGLKPLQIDVRTQKHSDEASSLSQLSSCVSSRCDRKASYDIGGRLDRDATQAPRLRPLQTDVRRRQTQKHADDASSSSQLSSGISCHCHSEASYDIGGLQDRDASQRSSDEHSETAPFENLSSIYETEMSFNFDGHVESLQRNVFAASYPVVNPHGSVSLLLRHLVRVDITPGGAVSIHHIPGNAVVTTNSTRDKTRVFHPNSRVLQDGPDVRVWTHDSQIAKISENKGVVFAPSPSSPVSYQIDDSGTNTIFEKFFAVRDFLVPLDASFFDELGDRSLDRCHAMVSETSCTAFPDAGDDVWEIGDVQIRQDRHGNVEVSMRDSRCEVEDRRHQVENSRHHIDNRRLQVEDNRLQIEDKRHQVEDNRLQVDDCRRHVLRVIPVSGVISVKTSRFSADVGCCPTQYVSVQMGNSKLTTGVGGLMAWHGSHKAGLDSNKEIVIF